MFRVMLNTFYEWGDQKIVALGKIFGVLDFAVRVQRWEQQSGHYLNAVCSSPSISVEGHKQIVCAGIETPTR